MLKLDAPTAPIRPGEIQQQPFAFRLGLFERRRIIIAPNDPDRTTGGDRSRGGLARHVRRLGRGLPEDLLVILILVVGQFLFGDRRSFRVVAEPRLKFRREFFDLGVGHAAGVDEIDVRGVVAGDDDVGIGVVADLEQRKFFPVRAGGENARRHKER